MAAKSKLTIEISLKIKVVQQDLIMIHGTFIIIVIIINT